MIETPAVPRRALLLAAFLSFAHLPFAPPLLAAENPGTPLETIEAADAQLPRPELQAGLLESQRTTGSWLDGYYAESATGPVLETDLLEQVLAGLTLPQAQAEPTFFEALEDWLESYFGARSEPVLPDWLRSFRLPEKTMLWVFYLSCALIVLLALAIIINEVRHARSRRKASSSEQVASGNSVPSARALEPEPTQLAERPGWLLDRLITSIGLSLNTTRGASLTRAELTRASQGLPGEIAQPLVALATTAERIRYDDEAPFESDIKAVTEKGALLLQHLEARR